MVLRLETVSTDDDRASASRAAGGHACAAVGAGIGGVERIRGGGVRFGGGRCTAGERSAAGVAAPTDRRSGKRRVGPVVGNCGVRSNQQRGAVACAHPPAARVGGARYRQPA